MEKRTRNALCFIEELCCLELSITLRAPFTGNPVKFFFRAKAFDALLLDEVVRILSRTFFLVFSWFDMSEMNLAYISRILWLMAMYKTKFTPSKKCTIWYMWKEAYHTYTSRCRWRDFWGQVARQHPRGPSRSPWQAQCRRRRSARASPSLRGLLQWLLK